MARRLRKISDTLRDGLFGLGTLLVVIPSLLIGVSFADELEWPPVSDIRVRLVLLGAALLFFASISLAAARYERD